MSNFCFKLRSDADTFFVDLITYSAMDKPHFFLPFVPLQKPGAAYKQAFLHLSYGTRFKPSPLETWVRLIHGQIRYLQWVGSPIE